MAKKQKLLRTHPSAFIRMKLRGSSVKEAYWLGVKLAIEETIGTKPLSPSLLDTAANPPIAETAQKEQCVKEDDAKAKLTTPVHLKK